MPEGSKHIDQQDPRRYRGCLARSCHSRVRADLLPLPLVAPLVRELPRIDPAPLRSPLVWSLVALSGAGAYAARRGLAGMATPNLWTVIIGSAVVVIGGPLFGISRGFVDPTHLAQKSAGVHGR